MAQMATTTANDPQLLSHPLKEGWWTVEMAKSQIPKVHQVYNVN